MNIDWINILIGAVVGLALSPVPTIILRLYRAATGQKPTNPIDGTWYSAEYDIKSADPDNRNTILKVEVRRTIDGRVTVEPTDALKTANPNRPTKWKVVGQMYNDVLVGTWKSTIEHSSRHGTVLLKFCDDGRAIGYYLGYVDTPVYGYWLLGRNQEDLRALSDAVLHHFKWNDLKAIIDKHDPRSNKFRKKIAQPSPPPYSSPAAGSESGEA